MFPYIFINSSEVLNFILKISDVFLEVEQLLLYLFVVLEQPMAQFSVFAFETGCFITFYSKVNMVFNVEFAIELGFLTLYHAFNFVKLTLEISITIRRHIIPNLHLYCFNLCRSFSLILFDMLRYICYDLCLSLFPLYFEFILH